MADHPFDQLLLVPDDIDLTRSPLAGHLGAETYVLGAFNPGLTRLPNGNLLMMVRVAEALREPIHDGHVHAIRWDEGRYVLDAWPLEHADTADPRKFMLLGGGWKIMALTSLSWLLPVELSPDGTRRVAIHYDKAIAPQNSLQCYGVEDARISKVGERWLMTTCSVSPERHSTTLYTSGNGLDWVFADIVLDHQNKDMLIFEGLIGGQYWAQTRPLGDLYFAYPPGSEWRAGPSINLATSPDALHWKPHRQPGIRPHAGTVATARMGAGRRRSSPMRGGSPCGMASSPRRSWASIAPIGRCWTGMTPAWCCAAARGLCWRPTPSFCGPSSIRSICAMWCSPRGSSIRGIALWWPRAKAIWRAGSPMCSRRIFA